MMPVNEGTATVARIAATLTVTTSSVRLKPRSIRRARAGRLCVWGQLAGMGISFRGSPHARGGFHPGAIEREGVVARLRRAGDRGRNDREGRRGAARRGTRRGRLADLNGVV